VEAREIGKEKVRERVVREGRAYTSQNVIEKVDLHCGEFTLHYELLQRNRIDRLRTLLYSDYKQHYLPLTFPPKLVDSNTPQEPRMIRQMNGALFVFLNKNVAKLCTFHYGTYAIEARVTHSYTIDRLVNYYLCCNGPMVSTFL
jgi:hypothetical protein